MKNSKIVAQEAALAMWEARVGHRLAARLAEGADGLDADLTERLRFAREKALDRARQVRASAGEATVSVGGGAAAWLGGGWWVKVASVLPLVALAAGLLMIQHLHTEAQIATAAAIDAELLADDLPPAAYTDAGFAEFLKTPGE